MRNTVFITSNLEAHLLLDRLKRNRVRTVCASTNAYLFLHSKGLGETLELVDDQLPGGTINSILVRTERLARKLDADVARYLSQATGLQISQGWDYWDKWLFASSLLPLARWLEGSDLDFLPDRVAMCQFANPQDYFHPSLLRSQLYADSLARTGKRFVKIPFEFPLGAPHTPEVWRTSYRVSMPAKHLKGARLVHVPSAFYMQAGLSELYGREGFLGLDSPYYENPVLNRRIQLDRSATTIRPQPIEMAHPRRLYQGFVEALGLAHLEGMQRQVDHWLERLAFQYRAFKMLCTLRDRFDVQLEAITDHDGGLFGPLCSAFSAQRDSIKIVPHSTICIGPLPALRSQPFGLMASRRPLETFNGAKATAPNFLRGPEVPVAAGSKVAIVLNEIDGVSGLPVHGFRAMIDFLEGLVAGLSKMGLKPVLRARPRYPVRPFCDFDVDQWDGDLGELISETSLCIGVGQVTTAVARFWRAGVACMHVKDSELCIDEQYLLPGDGVACFVGRPYSEILPDILCSIGVRLAQRVILPFSVGFGGRTMR